MKWLFNSYYIINILITLVYPAFRYYQHLTKNKQFFTSVTYDKESHIIISFLILICIKYVRYFTSLKQFVYEVLFYLKLAFMFLFFLYSYFAFFWYLVLVSISWIFAKIPYYDGPTKLIPVIGENRFDELVLKRKNTKKANNYSFVVFYSTFSDKCTFSEEIWASLSLRYTVEGFFQFFKVDVEASETVAKKQDVAYGFGTELPILVMYKNGVEERRFPMKDKKGHTLQAKYYSKKELINFFDLESIYVDCTSSAK